tara:strand:+ start:837 stop:1301 length:465 start_codon:yes stop_codon:yes gene_type:complete
MIKKKFLLLFFLFLSSCGYEAIHSKNNLGDSNFSINKINFIGNRVVNLKIKERLNGYILNKKDKKFSLDISSVSKKTILAKNISGDPISFKNTTIVNIVILTEDKFKNNLQIVESFNYNNSTNKFDLKQYETEIINNLAQTISDKLIFKLSSIQ